MSRFVVRSPKLLLGALLALALGACQAIAGIEERKLDPDAAQVEASPQCKSYCNKVMSVCTGKNAVYTTMDICLGVCANLEPGDPLEPVGNTVACRVRQAEIAELEPDVNCRSAGPGGDGQCGSDCDAYCELFGELCPEYHPYPTQSACLKACNGLTDQARFDVIADHEGDSIECRLMHVSAAAVDPEAHCPHAPLVPAEPWCIGKKDDSPTCEEYCNINLAACDGALTQYESRQQCLDVCAALPLGMNKDQVGNTVACRRYHSFSSTLAAAQHCPHAGPSGDGHCGDTGWIAEGHTGNCESYCMLLAEACPDEFAAEMSDADQCMQTCLTLGNEAEPESKYSVARAKESTGVSCRILHTVRALRDPTFCAAALGGAPCTGG